MPVVPATPSFDPNILIFVVFLVVALVVVGVTVRRSLKHRRRRTAAEQAAAQHGWQYERLAPRDFLHALPATYPFSGGDNQGATNLITGGDFTSFNFYSWTRTSSTEETSSRLDFHVVLMSLPAPLPQVQITTKRGALRQGGALRFESATFNESWLVYSEHPQAAYDLLHPRMMEWLQHKAGNFTVQDERIYYWARGPQEVTAIEAISSDLRDFIDQIPGHVWQKARGEYPRPRRYSPVSDPVRFVQLARQHYREKGDSAPSGEPR